MISLAQHRRVWLALATTCDENEPIDQRLLLAETLLAVGTDLEDQDYFQGVIDAMRLPSAEEQH